MTLTSLLAFVSGAILARRKEPEPEPESFVCERCGIKSYNPHDIRERYCGRCHEFADLKEQVRELKEQRSTLLQQLVAERDLRLNLVMQRGAQVEQFPFYPVPPQAQASEQLQAQVRMGVVQLEHAIRDPGHFVGFCTCVPGRSAMFRHLPGMVDSVIDALDGK